MVVLFDGVAQAPFVAKFVSILERKARNSFFRGPLGEICVTVPPKVSTQTEALGKTVDYFIPVAGAAPRRSLCNMRAVRQHVFLGITCTSS